ncbi:MAG: anti-sigma 24 factor [Rubrivivax sp.]|nr:anti-sigma 24 factor [Rubrivivax sp.]
MWLSALADGDAAALPHAAALWRDDADARERWHTYHLIGDVMRSEELSSPPGRDAAFVARLRTRLASEPVPFAPAASSPAPTAAAAQALRAHARHLGWRAPAAVAAGFVAVAVTVAWMRPQWPFGERGAASGEMASLAGSGMRAVSSDTPDAGAALVADGRMIRDARLDAYLRAHQAARGGSPAALPGGGLRSVEMLVAPLPAAAAPLPRPASEPR